MKQAITMEHATKAMLELAVNTPKFFPQDKAERQMIAQGILRLCEYADQADWLVKRAIELSNNNEWIGLRGLRAIYSTAFQPRDEIEVDAPSRPLAGEVTRCPDCEGRGFLIVQKGEHSGAHPCHCGTKPPGNEFAPLTGQREAPRCQRCNDVGCFCIDKGNRHEWCTCQKADELREADPTWLDRLNASPAKRHRSPKPQPTPTQANEITQADVERAERKLREKRREPPAES